MYALTKMPAAITCHGCECATASHTKPAIPVSAPHIRTGLAPKRSMNRPLSDAVRNPAIAPGRRNTTLACRTDALKPYPATLRSIWTNSVRPRKPKYSPIPTNTVARLVYRTARRASIVVGPNGWASLRSQCHHATRTPNPTIATPIVLGDVQPQELPWVTVSSTADSPAASPAAPNQSIVPCEVRFRDGTTTAATTITATVNPVVSQNPRW